MKVICTIETEDFPQGAEGELVPVEMLGEEIRRALIPGYLAISYGGKLFALPWFRVRACDEDAAKLQRAAARAWEGT